MTTTNLFFKKRVIHSEGKNLISKSDSLDWVWQLAAMSSWGLRCVGLGILWMGVGQLMGQDSTWTEYRYAEGVVSSEGYMVDGQPAGYWRSFYPDAKRKSEGNWRGGKLEGEWVFFDSKGRLETTLSYASGRKQGTEFKWDSTGTLRACLPWKQDTLDGVEQSFDENGIETQTIPWQKGKREGIATDYAVEGEGKGRIIRRKGYRGDLLRWVEDINRNDDQGRKTGKWMTFWPSGLVRLEGPYLRGLKEGVFKQFSRRGDLEKTMTYHLGKLVEDAPEAIALDIRQTFHDNGEVANVGPWRNDTPMGTHRYFDREGHLVEVKVFRDGALAATGMLDEFGRRTGPWTLFWKDGSVRAKGEYAEGLQEGEWQFFDRDGRLEQQGGYRAGEWHGRWKWFYPGGELHRDERYRKGKEEGAFIELSQNGDTLARGDYERGLKQGAWVEHVNDDRKEGKYLDGDQDGLWVHYGPNGVVRFKGAFVAGVPTGEHQWYWFSGMRSVIGDHKGGQREGNWRYFDESGLVQLVRQYKAGRIVKVNGSKTDR